MEPVGAPNVHVESHLGERVLDVDDEQAFADAYDTAGAEEVQVIFIGRYEGSRSWFMLEEYWSGEPEREMTEDGERLAIPVDWEELARLKWEVGKRHDVDYCKWTVRFRA